MRLDLTSFRFSEVRSSDRCRVQGTHIWRNRICTKSRILQNLSCDDECKALNPKVPILGVGVPIWHVGAQLNDETTKLGSAGIRIGIM